MEKHFVEAEELQAYLDRELTAGRQAEVERHLRECAECSALVADLKRVSDTLQRWQVEPAPASLHPPALTTARARATDRPWLRFALAFGGTAAVVLLVLAVSIPNLLRSRMATSQTAQEHPQAPAPPERSDETAASGAGLQYAPEQARRAEDKDKAFRGRAASKAPAAAEGALAADQALVGANAMREKSAAPRRLIAYHVTMVVEVKEFEPGKEKLLRVVEEAGGYISQASTAETPDQPRRANLTVRVPAEKLSAVLAQLRGLGRVTHEQLTSDEVTTQVVDLEARLRNARATEQRLIAVLEQRTGKVRDILEVEQEIARTREEIERMEAQRLHLLHRVELATIEVALVEEFKAALQPAPVGTGTRLHNAFVEGYEGLVETLLGLALFFARYGLSLLFWGGFLWLAWRVIRRPLLKWSAQSFGPGAE